MAFPPDFLDDLRQRVPLSDVVGRRVPFDQRKTNRAKRDFWACCPFHSEKTPSFHVDDSKGRYYCFGCQAKGDAITFLMEHDGHSFPDAVETLAAMAGVPVPKPSPRERAQAKARAGLAEAMSAASEFFQEQLAGRQGHAARDYLNKRGVSDAQTKRFRLGFAMGGEGLRAHLAKLDLAPEQIVEAGLARPSQRGGGMYDYFRNRLIFPITDARERVIAFGGRALSAGVEPKYLNSPDTPLFNKSRVLYNLAAARRAARRAGTVIVAEGYMDVIALCSAGFEHAVAPLGTALTEHHLALLWAMADTPVLCFDGDEAGLQAAYRSLDRALPLLRPGRSLRFALLTGGQDPDDLIRAGGRPAMAAALEGALGLADMIWRREIEGRTFGTPEARATLERRLGDVAATIPDRGLQYHFRQEFRDRAWKFFEHHRKAKIDRSGKMHSRQDMTGAPSALLLSSPVVQRSQVQQNTLDGFTIFRRAEERKLLCLAIEYPWLTVRDCEQFASVDFSDSDLEVLRRAILEVFDTDQSLDREQLKRHLFSRGHARICEQILGRRGAAAGKEEDVAEGDARVEQDWLTTLSRLASVDPA